MRKMNKKIDSENSIDEFSTEEEIKDNLEIEQDSPANEEDALPVSYTHLRAHET